MKTLRLVLLLVLCLAVALPLQARVGRSISTIATPGVVPPGAELVTDPLPIPRLEVERAVHALAEAWNTGELDPLLDRDLPSRTRLLDLFHGIDVPPDARLNILSIGAVFTYRQYRQEDKLLSEVSAEVSSQIVFNDPVVGYQTLDGTGEWFFRVEDSVTPETIPGVPTPLLTAETGGGTDRPHITNVLPPAPDWDSSLTIAGEHFGASGAAGFVSRVSGWTTELAVVTWSERAIEAGFVPTSFGTASRAVTSDEPESGTLWICPLSDSFPVDPDDLTENCAGIGVVIHPTAAVRVAAQTPEISAIDPVSVAPGQTLRVSGQRFGLDPGTAVFHIGGRDIPAEISSWSETELDLTLPETVSGLLGQVGTLTVTNRHGRDAESTITFTPRLTVNQFTAEVAIDGYGYVECSKEGYVLDFDLINDWTVTGTFSSSRDITRHATFMPGPNDIGVFVNEGPRAGSANPRVNIECRSHNDATGVCRVTVQVRGPAGTVPAYEGSTTAPILRKLCLKTGLDDWEWVDD